MKAAIYTLGGKVNQYESRVIGEMLERNGYTLVDDKEPADIYVVNSCTVTAAADQKTRQHVRKLKREHPESIIVLTGCMTQAFPKEAENLPEADIILGNKNNEKLLELLDTYAKFGKRILAVEAHASGDPFVPCRIRDFEERTRAIVKIQDGCNRFCSYCIIPYSRGRVRSKPLDEIKAEIETIAANGYKEVVLVGINLSSYGQDIGCTFPDAVACACSVDGIERVRLGSLEPDHLTEDVIERLSSQKKLCPQFHISLQSGCDNTLKRMNRHYIASQYKELCNKLRSTFKDCSLTTDIMVGFPGESEEDFETSLNFAKEIHFEKMHVFPYSIREGTVAAKMKDQLSKKVKSERAKKMIALADEMRSEYFSTQKGKEYEVLFERKKGEYNLGHTKNYIPVKVKSDKNLQDEILKVIIIGSDNEYCEGKIK